MPVDEFKKIRFQLGCPRWQYTLAIECLVCFVEKDVIAPGIESTEDFST
jgi:hypothetical protein